MAPMRSLPMRVKIFSVPKRGRPDREYIADQEKERLDNISIDSHHEDEIHQTLREALSELPEIHRQVLTLHYLGGMSCREIAQFSGSLPMRSPCGSIAPAPY